MPLVILGIIGFTLNMVVFIFDNNSGESSVFTKPENMQWYYFLGTISNYILGYCLIISSFLFVYKWYQKEEKFALEFGENSNTQ